MGLAAVWPAHGARGGFENPSGRIGESPRRPANYERVGVARGAATDGADDVSPSHEPSRQREDMEWMVVFVHGRCRNGVSPSRP